METVSGYVNRIVFRNEETGYAVVELFGGGEEMTVVGSLSMVGVPLFAGFISKLMFAQAAVQNQVKMLPALIVLGISTILNAIYFMKTVIRIYTPYEDYPYERVTFRNIKLYAAALVCFIVLNVFLGVSSQPIVDLIDQGLAMFS